MMAGASRPRANARRVETIRQRSKKYSIELANGYNGYLPTPEQHALGGYSTWPAISSHLEVDASPKIRDHLLGLLEAVSKA